MPSQVFDRPATEVSPSLPPPRKPRRDSRLARRLVGGRLGIVAAAILVWALSCVERRETLIPERVIGSDPPSAALEPVAGTALEAPFGMRLRFIPGGLYWIGSPLEEKGRDSAELRHEVEISRGFWLAETEVTQAQWRQLVPKNPSRFTACGESCPVEQVSWWEAVTFANLVSDRAKFERCYELVGCQGTLGGADYHCQAAIFQGFQCTGYRLPSEAEWELAARAAGAEKDESTAPDTSALRILEQHNGPEIDPIAWYGGNSGVSYPGGFDCSAWPEKQFTSSRCGPQPVGKKAPNNWGLTDMLGNVLEWTGDGFGAYPAFRVRDPLLQDGASRVLRGGSWASGAWLVRPASRNGYPPAFRGGHLGFRLARGQAAPG